MRFLKLEYAPTVVLVLAIARMADLANAGLFQQSYAIAGVFSFVSLGSGLLVFAYQRKRDVTAARIAVVTGILFFIMLFAIGELLYATYFPY